MKTSLIVILFLLCSQLLSQIDKQDKINHRDFLKERLGHDSNLPEQIKSSLEPANFQNNDSKRIVNKTILDNGFVLTEEIHYDWVDPNWVNKSKYTYTYDENNNRIMELISDWNGANWVFEWLWHYDYHESNIMSGAIKERWDGTNWEQEYIHLYNYDENNNLIEELHQELVSGNWNNDKQFTYAYDASNNRILQLYEKWSGSNWVKETKYTYTYNGNNTMNVELWERWDNTNWVNYIKYTYTYDATNYSGEKIMQSWNDPNWVNTYQYKHNYDVDHNLFSVATRPWLGTSWGPIWGMKDYFYDGYNNRIEYIYKSGGSGLVNKESHTYTYQSITKIEQLTDGIKTYRLSNNYPNPFNPSTKINYSIPNQSYVTLEVFDVMGRELRTLINKEQPIGNYEVEFNASGLTSGIYFYRIQAGEFVETKKMILMK